MNKKTIEAKALMLAVKELQVVGCCALCCFRIGCAGYAWTKNTSCSKKLISGFMAKAKK